MIRSAIGFDDVFDSLAPVCNFSKPLVLSRTDAVLPPLTAGLKYSICYPRTLPSIYGRNGRALSKDLICFEGLVDFVVGLLDSFRPFGVEGEERFRRFFGNDATVMLLGLAQDPRYS